MSSESRVLFVFECGTREADAMRIFGALMPEQTTEVLGLFVEDEDLLGAARLPGVAEVSIASLEAADFEPERIARQLVDQAREARRIFETSARHLKLRHSFRISRGRTLEKLLDEAAEAEMVVVCRPLRAAGLRARQGIHFEALVARHGKVLFVNEPWHSGTSVVAVCDDVSEACAATLDTARDLARAEQLDFVVATVGAAGEHTLDARVHLPEPSEEALINLCQTYDARLLVMRPIAGVDGRKLLLGLLDRLSCSLLWLNGDV